MADASDSKSDAGNSVWVQVPSPALVHLLGSPSGINTLLFNDIRNA